MKSSSLKHLPPTDHLLSTGGALLGENELICPTTTIQSGECRVWPDPPLPSLCSYPQNHGCCILVKAGYAVVLGFIAADFVLAERGSITMGLGFFLYSLSEAGSCFP